MYKHQPKNIDTSSHQHRLMVKEAHMCQEQELLFVDVCFVDEEGSVGRIAGKQDSHGDMEHDQKQHALHR
jgi:hypothetical protein